VAGVEQPEVIDLVSHDPQRDAFVLVAIEDRSWNCGDQQLLDLQAKLKNYVSFAEDGQMLAMYPDSAGKPWVIRLECVEEPSADVARLIDAVSAAWIPANGSLVVEVTRAD
jgi:hypothetical protein